MTLLFKILGFVLIIFTTSAIGFLKANELNSRYKKLCNFSKSIGNLKEHIRLHSGERERLLKICFGEFPPNYSALTKDDVELMGEFFKDFGLADTKAEYERLLKAAQDKKNERLYLVMQTICSTGIRVRELKFITVDAVMSGQAQVRLKGKIRTILLTKELCNILKKYIREQKLTSGSVFVTRKGKPLDRFSIWKAMKSLCESAGVEKEKVFPHNLRHLFARTYYSIQKDIVRLADILGHSSINTTRIYTIEDGDIHRRQMQRLGLVRMQN